MGAARPVQLALVAHIPREGVASFRAYEDQVLPLLGEHGGKLARRLRNGDGTIEIHLIEFATAAGLAHYRADPRRLEAASLLEASKARLELISVEDVV